MEEQNNQTPASPEPSEKLAEAPPDDAPMHVDPDAVSAQPTTNPDHLLQAHTGRNNHSVVAILAVIIAIALAGLAVFIYMQSQDAAEPSTSNETNTTTTPPPAVTAEEVDNLNASLDESLDSTNDTTDFNDTDLNDSTLNL